MPENTRDFHLGDVLSVTTGLLVSPRRFDGVVDILNWMTDRQLWTSQIPGARKACAGSLLAQHPDLAEVGGSAEIDKAEVERWLAAMVERYGETRPVAPLAPGQRAEIGVYEEIRTMREGA